MLDRANQIELAKASAKAYLNPTGTFSVEGKNLSKSAIDTAFMNELRELGKNAHEFQRNKETIFELIEIQLTEIIPAKVMQAYGQFADVQTIGQGEKAVFKVKISEAAKKRAKQFVTKVGLAGRYETFKLDGYELEVPTSAIGAASRIEWEEILDGRYTMADFYNLILEGMDEKVYEEIANSLTALTQTVTAKNKASKNAFDEKEFDRLLATADVYGHSTIYCTFEFAATMLPADSNKWSDAMKDQIWNHGSFANYKGHTVVVLPQSFTDVDNATKVINPSKAFIIPNGAEKPVKVVFEGSQQVKSFENRDWSTEIQTYHKVGVASYLVNPGICTYENTSLTLENK